MDPKRSSSPLLDDSSKRQRLNDQISESNPSPSGQSQSFHHIERQIEFINLSEIISTNGDDSSVHSTDMNDLLEVMFGPIETSADLECDLSSNISTYSEIRSSTPIDGHYQPFSPDPSFLLNITFDEMTSQEILNEFMRDETSSGEEENDWFNDSFQQFIEGIEEDYWGEIPIDSGIFSLIESEFNF